MGRIQKNRPTIGFMLNQLDVNFFVSLWNGAADIAEEADCNLVLICGKKWDDQFVYSYQENACYHIPKPDLFDGMVVTTGTMMDLVPESDFVCFLERFKGLPMVSLLKELPGIPSLLVDNKASMKAMVNHLLDHHGYRKIAFVRGPAGNPDAEARFEAYQEGLSEHDIPLNADWVFTGNFSYESGAAAVRYFIDEKKLDCDAIMFSNDIMMIEAIIQLKKRGFRIPEDIAVTGYDDIDEVKYFDPPASSIYQPVYEIGRKSVELVLSRLNGAEIPDVTRLKSKLCIRKSCGCNNLPIEDVAPVLNLLNHDYNSIQDIILNNLPLLVGDVLEALALPDDLKNKYELLIRILLKDFAEVLAGRMDENEFIVTGERILLDSIFYKGENLNWDRAFFRLGAVIIHFQKQAQNVKIAERIIQTFQILISQMRRNKIGYEKNKGYYIHMDIRGFISECALARNMKKLMLDCAEFFKRFDVKTGYLSIYEGAVKKRSGVDWELPEKSRNYLSMVNGEIKVLEENGVLFNTCDLIPFNLFPEQKRFTWYMRELYVGDDQYGFLVCEIGMRDEIIYINTHHAICNTLRTIGLWFSRDRAEVQLKAAMEDLKSSNQKLSELDALKNDFIANITHDFRSPLMMILNNSDLGLNYSDSSLTPEMVKKRYKVIYDSSLKLKMAIDRLLEIARMDSQGLVLNVSPINVAVFIKRLTDYYQSAVMYSGIKIIADIPQNTEVVILTDQDKLEEIINNVVSNAIKFVSPEKGVIKIDLLEQGDKISIRVTDNGIGIPQDKLKSIFGRFEQAESGRNSRFQGTGIGLAFSGQLAGFLHGRIWAESDGEGKGASFIIELPKGKREALPAEFKEYGSTDLRHDQKRQDLTNLIRAEVTGQMKSKQVRSLINRLNEDGEYDPKHAVIMLVDDHEEILDIVMQYLQKAGYQNFILAFDGSQAVEAAYQYKPDIIISDYNMPNMRGDQFHDKLISNPDFRNIPFIFLTAIADKGLLLDRTWKGASAYLSKPVDEKELTGTIFNHLLKYYELKQAVHQAAIDELTGLNNKRSLFVLIKNLITTGAIKDLAVIFMDLDHFKWINDTYGHSVGDQVLAETGKALRETLRKSDIVARYGGEEFVMALPDTACSNAYALARNIQGRIKANKIIIEGAELKVSASFGIVSLRQHHESIIKAAEELGLKAVDNNEWMGDIVMINGMPDRLPQILVSLADQAMYISKRTRCNTCLFESTVDNDFKDGVCRNCGSADIDKGRDKITILPLV